MKKGRDPGQHKPRQSDLRYRQYFNAEPITGLVSPTCHDDMTPCCQIKQLSPRLVSSWRNPREEQHYSSASTTPPPGRERFQTASDHFSVGRTRSLKPFRKLSTSRPVEPPSHTAQPCSLWCFHSVLWILGHSLEGRPCKSCHNS